MSIQGKHYFTKAEAKRVIRTAPKGSVFEVNISALVPNPDNPQRPGFAFAKVKVTKKAMVKAIDDLFNDRWDLNQVIIRNWIEYRDGIKTSVYTIG